MGETRFYRDHLTDQNRWVSFGVTVQETDLLVMAQHPLREKTRELVIQYRGHIEAYIQQHPEFMHALMPWISNDPTPRIVRQMILAGQKAGVGPMAAVAGALAETVGRELLAYTDEVIVENGGDVFLKTGHTETLAVFAGRSPLSMRLGLRVNSQPNGMAVCTSSGTVGHSYSSGNADAVCVVSTDCALADAAATAIGNRVLNPGDIEAAVASGRRIENVNGILVIAGEHMGAWGDIEVVPLVIKNS